MNVGQFKKGEKRPGQGRGRPKGGSNKQTIELKDMILGALDKAGGVEYLAKQALESPTAFLSLVGRVLPTQVTGKDGSPLELVRVMVSQVADDVRTKLDRLVHEEPASSPSQLTH